MNKKRLYIGIFLALILSSFLATAALTTQFKLTNKWESSNMISSSQGSLQEVTNQDLFKPVWSCSWISGCKWVKIPISDASASNPGHNLSEIWVSVNGNEMTFNDAVQNTDLCGITNKNLDGIYSNAPDPSHLGTEVEVTTPYDGQTKSLQEAINEGDLVNIDGEVGAWGTCIDGVKTKNCVTDKVCAGIDGCAVPLTEVCTDYLLTNEQHSNLDCESEGGSVYSFMETVRTGWFGTTTRARNICKFTNTASCPSGWDQYKNWSATRPGEEYARMPMPWAPCASFSTDSHTFADTERESCSWTWGSTNCNFFVWPGYGCSYISPTTPRNVYATVTELGCY